MSPGLVGISGYLPSHQSNHLLARFAACSGKSRISRMTRVGFRSSRQPMRGRPPFDVRRPSKAPGPLSSGRAPTRRGPE